MYHYYTDRLKVLVPVLPPIKFKPRCFFSSSPDVALRSYDPACIIHFTPGVVRNFRNEVDLKDLCRFAQNDS